MRRNQIIAIGFCLALFIAIYFFGKTRKPKDDNAGPTETLQGHAQPQQQTEKLNIEEYISDINSKIVDKTEKEKVENLMLSKSYKELLTEYQKLDKPLAIAYYSKKLAE